MRITKAEIKRRLEGRIEAYEYEAKIPYDPGNGWDQVPRGKTYAAVLYGQISELESLLEG